MVVCKCSERGDFDFIFFAGEDFDGSVAVKVSGGEASELTSGRGGLIFLEWDKERDDVVFEPEF